METDPDQDREAWHAELRRRDAEDIATGRRTAAQVNRDNAWIPNSEEYVILNMAKAARGLRRR